MKSTLYAIKLCEYDENCFYSRDNLEIIPDTEIVDDNKSVILFETEVPLGIQAIIKNNNSTELETEAHTQVKQKGAKPQKKKHFCITWLSLKILTLIIKFLTIFLNLIIISKDFYF